MSSEVRISGGYLKGQTIKTLKKGNYRITMEQVRSSIFNILDEKIKDCSFLDLFAGSGIVGIEALSYGAKKVVFVEKHLPAVRLMRENLKKFGLENRTEVHLDDVFTFLRKNPHETFDIIFADPPYELGEKMKDVVKYIGDNKWLKKDGMLIIEHHKKTELLKEYSSLVLIFNKNYGETVLSFYGCKGVNT
uniref:16S rRNA (Guanine(966)-N(2))-methyltransferase RsmD n=1 Tax=Dictyoglomus thermophilum TaxID=14 RepID=A0A7C3MN24_DICTH